MAKKRADQALLDVLRGELGYRERPDGSTKFAEWWSDRHNKPAVWRRAAWCDMFISWGAARVGLTDVVGDSAWTPGHAAWFAARDQWGLVPRVGAVVFFDWAGTKNIPAIDHVGVVEAVRGSTIVTIEGNTLNAVMRRERSMSTIAGFGYPAYLNLPAAAAKPSSNWTEDLVKTFPLIKPGAKGWDVKTVAGLLAARDYAIPEGVDDTVYSPPFVARVKEFQRAAGLKEDGEVGPKTLAKLLRVA
ncbi:peptidoglycan-binding protein [Herbidospora daliensis]|uniref:peptidoglycan-binding protein n=1 Tax=Herbidospora daliensis TaxID=295585 RepID=UPI0007C7B8D8|nr:peptidoglycan-binding protein [Herbidospora daliensis]